MGAEGGRPRATGQAGDRAGRLPFHPEPRARRPGAQGSLRLPAWLTGRRDEHDGGTAAAPWRAGAAATVPWAASATAAAPWAAGATAAAPWAAGATAAAPWAAGAQTAPQARRETGLADAASEPRS